MFKKYIVSFLDILGFSNYASIDSGGALSLLINYQGIINFKLYDKNIERPYIKSDSVLSKLAEEIGIDSFLYFIPFSDSIFIVSEDANSFICQLSNFIKSSYLFNSNIYMNPENISNPTLVTNQEIRIDKSGKFTTIESLENAYPILFRGGIAYDKIDIISMSSIINRDLFKYKNLSGIGVVKAVSMEKTGKGPRIFCDIAFVKLLNDSKIMYVNPINNESIYEILWPAFQYIENNNNDLEIYSFDELFTPAVNLWKAFNHLDYGIHYYELMKLIIRSTMKYFSYHNYESECKKYIIDRIISHDLKSKIDDLLQ